MPTPAEKRPMKLRLPILPNEELIRRADEYGPVKGWSKVMEAPARQGESLTYMTVPEIYAADTKYWSTLMAFILGVDPTLPMEEIARQGIPVTGQPTERYKRYMLMSTWLHVKHLRNGWTRTVMAGWASEGAGITRTKLLLLDLPDDDIWTDDERLALKFVKAAFEWEMTDELFAAASEAWTPEWIIAVMSMLLHYYGYSTMFEMVGFDRCVGLTDDVPLAQIIGLQPPAEQ